MDKLKITYDVNDHGQVTNVIVYVNDEETAHKIENLVNECASHTDSSNS